MAKDGSSPLSPDEIGRRLAVLPDWSVTAGKGTPPGQDLTRQFHFTSFALAMAFMQRAAPRIDAMNHHPRWENSYDKVTVWLSTHDAGNAVTAMDFALAATLDDVYSNGQNA